MKSLTKKQKRKVALEVMKQLAKWDTPEQCGKIGGDKGGMFCTYESILLGGVTEMMLTVVHDLLDHPRYEDDEHCLQDAYCDAHGLLLEGTITAKRFIKLCDFALRHVIELNTGNDEEEWNCWTKTGRYSCSCNNDK